MANRADSGKVVSISSLMVITFVILSFLSIQQLRKSNELRILDEDIENLNELSLQLFKTDGDFLAYELNEEPYYQTGTSVYFQRHDSLLNAFRKLADHNDPKDSINNNILDLLNQYDAAFDTLAKKIRVRGYKNYGIEGDMRSTAHEIESKRLILQVELLTLRRHEKDYLLRFDQSYVSKFDSVITTISTTKPDGTKQVLKKYKDTFHSLVEISNTIGLESQTNLKGSLDARNNELITAINKRDNEVDAEIFTAYRQGILLFTIGIVGCTILSIVLIVMVAKRL